MLQNRCQRKVDRTEFRVFSPHSQRILFWWTRSPRRLVTKSSTSCSWWKFSSEKIIFDWVRSEDSELRAKKFRIYVDWIATRSWVSKTTTAEVNQWTDQVQRERIQLCSELEMKNCLIQESYVRSCQEIEEFRRRCNKEVNGVTRQKMNEHSIRHDQEFGMLNFYELLISRDSKSLVANLEYSEIHERNEYSRKCFWFEYFLTGIWRIIQWFKKW